MSVDANVGRLVQAAQAAMANAKEGETVAMTMGSDNVIKNVPTAVPPAAPVSCPVCGTASVNCKAGRRHCDYCNHKWMTTNRYCLVMEDVEHHIRALNKTIAEHVGKIERLKLALVASMGMRDAMQRTHAEDEAETAKKLDAAKAEVAKAE